MKALLTGLIALAMGLSACKRTTGIQPTNTSIYEYAISVMPDTNANNLNPYDSAGYDHNLLLNGAEGCIAKSAKDLASVDGCIIRYAGQLRLDTATVNMNSQQWFLNDSMNWYRNILSEMPYDFGTEERIRILIGIIRSAATEPSMNYSTLRSRFVDFEKGLLNDRTLNDKDRSLLLQTVSIARYSAAYWMHKYPGQPGKPEAHILGWGLGIAADVSSFLMFPHVGFAATCSAAMSFVGDNFL